MRRGFKAWCERTSREYRVSLGVPLANPLDPGRVADLLGVRVTTPEAIPGVSQESVVQLTKIDRDSWSAVTISLNGKRLVILNSGQSVARQTSSLAHELAHIILNHTTDQAVLTDEGFLFRGNYDAVQEQEANWLASCLLVPRDGLLAAGRRNADQRYLAMRFGVSREMIAWRLRMTGVSRQLKREERLRTAAGGQ
ncbi:MAG: ImmA/IrrE family metallo-endopeptidase [Gammaproteobacteria bacterium]|nr:ImmA/IrrE family metallo-endopeptidase [Gammaproteobacteria bacterium]